MRLVWNHVAAPLRLCKEARVLTQQRLILGFDNELQVFARQTMLARFTTPLAWRHLDSPRLVDRR